MSTRRSNARPGECVLRRGVDWRRAAGVRRRAFATIAVMLASARQRAAGWLLVSDDPGITFTTFVLSLATTAAVHFGDVSDPTTGEKNPGNLQGAGHMIDILDMLERKTRGNLTAEERQFLEQILYELRLRFVDAQKREAGPIRP